MASGKVKICCACSKTCIQRGKAGGSYSSDETNRFTGKTNRRSASGQTRPYAHKTSIKTCSSAISCLELG